MKTIAKNVYWSAIRVVARIWELFVANEDFESSSVEISLMNAGNTVNDAGNADRIIGSPPSITGDRYTSRQRALPLS